MDKLFWRRAVNFTVITRPVALRPVALRPVCASCHQLPRRVSSMPTIMQPSFWKSMIPKPFRRRSGQTVNWGVPRKPKSKEWNPATFFIVIFLFIGSMSIQMIAMKKEFDNFMRRSEVRVGLLREVVEKLQRGEEVDVEKALGTGDVEKELAWEDVLREIERDDILKNTKDTDKAKQSAPTTVKVEAREAKKSKEAANPESTAPQRPKTGNYSNFF